MSQIKPPHKIAHIGIAVSSLDAAIPFYTKQLGSPLLGCYTNSASTGQLMRRISRNE